MERRGGPTLSNAEGCREGVEFADHVVSNEFLRALKERQKNDEQAAYPVQVHRGTYLARSAFPRAWTSRRSSGSMRAESAVDPTRSENITVT
jgi:hypothetical protein